MKSRFAVRLLPALLGCLALACSSTRSPKQVDSALLAHVSEAEYRAINEARAAATQAKDEVAFAREELALTKEHLSLARDEQDVAEAQVDAAEARVEAARKDEIGDDDAVNQELEDAHAYRRWVEAKIRYSEARIEAARAKVEVAEADFDLAEARVELAKAEAVADLDDGHMDEFDVDSYRRVVDRRESVVADAKADLEAARTKVESKKRLIDERAESVPAQFKRDTIDDDEDDDGLADVDDDHPEEKDPPTSDG